MILAVCRLCAQRGSESAGKDGPTSDGAPRGWDVWHQIQMTAYCIRGEASLSLAGFFSVIPKPRAFTSGARDLTACRRFVQVLPVFGKVIPLRIYRLNQFQLLLAPPAFDFILAGDCGVRIAESFVVNQAREVVSAGEARNQVILVLPDAAHDVSGDAGVKARRAGAVAHDVDEELFGRSHSLWFTVKAFRTSVIDVHMRAVRSLAPLVRARGFGITQKN